MRSIVVASVLLLATFIHADDGPSPDDLPKCPPEWKVELIAAPPTLKHPSVVCCAPDGRVFVGEDPMDMGNDSNTPTDRILCFHPDGKVTVFAEKLHAVFGLLYLDGKLIVHHVPKLSVFTDDHGVGKDRVDLIDCTNPNPAPGFNDHIPANIRLGMDGWVYMSVGDKGIYNCTGRDGSKAELRGGGVLRLRPDGTKLEVYCRGTRNHLDLAITSEDEIFSYDNTDDGNGWWTRVTHMVDGGNYGYPWDYKPRRPYTLWMMADYGGGSPTGAMAYTEDALPAEYRDNAFFCEWGRKQLLRLDLQREGGSYKIASRQDFLTAGKKEFRPVGIAVQPDGMGFYVTDWNFAGWKQNVVAGRLLKVTYTGKSQATPKPAWYLPAALGQPFEALTEDLIAGLKHPAESVRRVAQRNLAGHLPHAEPQLKALLRDTAAPTYARTAAIWTLDRFNPQLGHADIVAVLSDRDPAVRRQAARQLARSGATAVGPLTTALQDADASVRFQAATALGRTGSVEAVPALRAALAQADLFARYAAFTALNRIGRANPAAWPAIVEGLADSNPAVAEATAFALRDTYDAGLATALSRLAGDAARTPVHRATAVQLLAELHRQPAAWDGKWWHTQPVKQPRPEKTVEYAATPIVRATLIAALAASDSTIARAAADGAAVSRDAELVPALIELFRRDKSKDMQAAAIRAVAANVNPTPAVAFLIEQLPPGASDDTVKAEVVAALDRIGTPEAIDGLMFVANCDGGPKAVARAFAGLAAHKKGVGRMVSELGKLSGNAEVREAVIAGIVSIGGEKAIAALQPLLASENIENRRRAIHVLGLMNDRSAVIPLLTAFTDPSTRDDAIAALSLTPPDGRAAAAYIAGLREKNATVHEACRKALLAVRRDAYPAVETALQGGLLPKVVGELQNVYTSRQPVKWTALGPFPVDATPLDTSSLKQPTEVKLAGKTLRWKKPSGRDAEASSIDLRGQLQPSGPLAGYAQAELFSPAAGETEIVGEMQGGSVELFLNGRSVLNQIAPGKFHVKVSVQAGTNTVLARSIYAETGNWRIYLNSGAAKSGPLFAATATKPLSLNDYSNAVKKQAGDTTKGRALFADLNGLGCMKCHRVNGGVGGDVGPDLAGVGAKYNRAQLTESILEPSKQILDGYQQTQIATVSGQVFIGIARGETADSVTLIDAEAKTRTIRKADIDERATLSKSLMPEGLHAGLTLTEFADVIAYLESLKEKPAAK